MPTLEGARAPILLGARAPGGRAAPSTRDQSECIVCACVTGGLHERAGVESCSKSLLLFVNNTAHAAQWTSCVSNTNTTSLTHGQVLI